MTKICITALFPAVTTRAFQAAEVVESMFISSILGTNISLQNQSLLVEALMQQRQLQLLRPQLRRNNIRCCSTENEFSRSIYNSQFY